jgi:hypothetical protein
MVCFYHTDKPALGICKYCNRGLCIECATFVNDILACKDRHEDQVGKLNLMNERGILQSKRLRPGYGQNAIFYFLVGFLFTGFGILQYRYLGLQAIFLILVGLFLLYVAIANLVESRKYK